MLLTLTWKIKIYTITGGIKIIKQQNSSPLYNNVLNVKWKEATKRSVFKIIASARELYCRLSDIQVAPKKKSSHSDDDGRGLVEQSENEESVIDHV